MKKYQVAVLLTLALLCATLATARMDRVKKVGEYPNFLALSPDGKTAYVTSFGTGELLAVDLEEKSVTRSMEVGEAPLGIALADNGKFALWPARIRAPWWSWIWRSFAWRPTSRSAALPTPSQSAQGIPRVRHEFRPHKRRLAPRY